DAITIDLSATEGSDPHGGGVDWVGVKLGTVTVEPSTLGVVGGQWANLPKPTNWTIEGLGVRGEMDTGSWQSDYRSGHLAIENIHFKGTKEGHYSASYKNVEIRSPWFKEPVRGNATWFKAEGGNYKLNLDGIHADKRPSLAGGALTLEPLDLQFVKIENGGLLLQGRAHLTLQAEGKHFATFDAERVGYGLDGLLYFGDDGKSSMTVPLHGNATLGSTPAELQKALLTAGPKENLLKVDVDTRLRLSANPVLPSAPTSLHYAMKSGGSPGVFSAPEVQVDPFSMDVAFPMGSPSMTAKINTNYTGKQSGQAESAMSADGISGGAPSISSNRFAGEVDLAMFGGSPLKAKFVLGYDQGKDYFATRVDVPMGRAGVVIIPEILTLYRLSGGFAYNFGDDVFKDGGSVLKAKPDFKGVTQLMAGARLGSADQFIYTLDGQLVIGSSGTARMDFGAWVCSMNPSGNPPLRGQLSYTNGTFDGALWGGFHYLGDMVAIDLGSSKETAACSLHFGGGEWHIYAGNRDGTRISGRIFGNTTESYLMLGSDVGLAVGGRQNWYFGAGVGVKAYAKAWLDMGLQITPQPKVIGDFRAGMEAGICVKHVGCISAGVNAHVHAEALPLSVSANCCIDLPWPFDEACFTVKM
ncbi:MAG: hypothetical protein LWX11_02670, partial [Firmicutes bacterium]|nr:hypothetical protein [Bacillota bacterium]